MIFSTELANEVKLSDNSNNTKYLEAGIHDNVKFVSAKFAESPTGKKFIEFTFEKDGKSLVHTEWEPAVRESDTEEQNQSKATNQVTRIMRASSFALLRTLGTIRNAVIAVPTISPITIYTSVAPIEDSLNRFGMIMVSFPL